MIAPDLQQGNRSSCCFNGARTIAPTSAPTRLPRSKTVTRYACAAEVCSLRHPWLRLGPRERVLHGRAWRRACRPRRRHVAVQARDRAAERPWPRPIAASGWADPCVAGETAICASNAGPIESAVAHLREHRVLIEQGPVVRIGANGKGKSVYFREPAGSQLKFISYVS